MARRLKKTVVGWIRKRNGNSEKGVSGIGEIKVIVDNREGRDMCDYRGG